MTHVQEAFLNILGAALDAQPIDDPGLNASEWDHLFQLASEQKVLPLVFDRARYCAPEKAYWRNKAVGEAANQIAQTKEFLNLLQIAHESGLRATVLKGIVCRNLYPSPMLRPSVDEDLLIASEQTENWHQFLTGQGLNCDQTIDSTLYSTEKRIREDETELSYHGENSPIYIELHKLLFDPESKVCGGLNDLFNDVQTMTVQIEEVSVQTLAPTEHLLYLILHAYKHFLYSGIGVRSVCDIGMFSKTYEGQIEWERLRTDLGNVDALYFAKALFQIIDLYLMPGEKLGQLLDAEKIDVVPLLADMLAGGVHGDATLTRLHSSNMTLSAVEAKQKESSASGGNGPVISSLFLPLKSMRGRYPYLNKAPFLLPVAWVQRMVRYLKETRRSGKRSTIKESTESIRLGKERVELLKKYHII